MASFRPYSREEAGASCPSGGTSRGKPGFRDPLICAQR
jgi:hypothetical protein